MNLKIKTFFICLVSCWMQVYTLTAQIAVGTVNPNVVIMNNPKLLLGITYDCRSSLTVNNYGLAGYHNTDASWRPGVDSVFNDFPMSGLRYPANGIMQGFQWKKSVGPDSLRIAQKIFAQVNTPAQIMEFGFDEFMAMTASRGVDPKDVQIMVPIYDSANTSLTQTQFTAAIPNVIQSNADWVEYCNAPNDSTNPGGGIDWAAERAANGHPLPYNIKLWNMGNEPYTTGEFNSALNGATAANNYISTILPIINAMLAIDSSIHITVTGTGRATSAWTYTLLNSTLLQGKIYGINVHYFMTEQVIGSTIPYGVDTVAGSLGPVAAAAQAKGYKLIVGDHAHAILGTNPNAATQDLAMQWQGANLTTDFLLTMSQINNIERSNFWVYGLVSNAWHPIRKNANGTFTLMPVAVMYKKLNPLFLDQSLAMTSTSPMASDGNAYSVRSSAFASSNYNKINIISVNRDKNNTIALQLNGMSGYYLTKANILQATSLSSDSIIESAILPDSNGNFILPPMSILILEYDSSNLVTMLPSVNLSIKLYIEGMYLGNSLMQPIIDPIANPTFCDTVEVSLIDANPPYTKIASVLSTLQTDGTGIYNFQNILSGSSYYIVVRHRNSLETWSKYPVTISSPTVSFVF